MTVHYDYHLEAESHPAGTNGWNVTTMVGELIKDYPEMVRSRSRRHASICSTLNTMETERLRTINPERKR